LGERDEGGGGAIQWTPRALAAVSGGGSHECATIAHLSAGAHHAAAVIVPGGSGSSGAALAEGDGGGAPGTGMMWGCGDFGALGRGDDVADHADAAPCHHGSLAGALLTGLSCGHSTSMGVDANGSLHLWGRMWGGAAREACTLPRPLSLSRLECAVPGRASLVVRAVSCSARRFVIVCTPGRGCTTSSAGAEVSTPPQTLVFEGMVGAAPSLVRPIEGMDVTRVAASADAAYVSLADGGCLRVALDVAGSGSSRVDELPLPHGTRTVGVAAARGLCAILARTPATAAPPAFRPPPQSSSSATSTSRPQQQRRRDHQEPSGGDIGGGGRQADIPLEIPRNASGSRGRLPVPRSPPVAVPTRSTAGRPRQPQPQVADDGDGDGHADPLASALGLVDGAGDGRDTGNPPKSRPGTAGSRPGTATGKPIWLE
jgi:hypothetical protein